MQCYDELRVRSPPLVIVVANIGARYTLCIREIVTTFSNFIHSQCNPSEISKCIRETSCRDLKEGPRFSGRHLGQVAPPRALHKVALKSWTDHMAEIHVRFRSSTIRRTKKHREVHPSFSSAGRRNSKDVHTDMPSLYNFTEVLHEVAKGDEARSGKPIHWQEASTW